MNPQTCCKLWTARERFFPKRFLPVHIDTNMHLRKFWKNTTEYLRVLLVQLYWTRNSQYLVYMYIYIHFYRLPLPARVRQLPLPLPPPLTASKPVTCSPSTAASAHAAANRLATHVFILCFLSETTWFGACCSWTFALSSDNFFSMQVLHEPGRWCLILFPCDLENRISGSVSLHLEQSNNSGEVADPEASVILALAETCSACCADCTHSLHVANISSDAKAFWICAFEKCKADSRFLRHTRHEKSPADASQFVHTSLGDAIAVCYVAQVNAKKD